MSDSQRTKRRDNGSGSVFQRSSDGRWIGYVSLPNAPDGKRRRKVVSAQTKGEVLAKLRTLRRDLDRAGDLPTSSPTLAQWLTYWLDNISAPRVRPSTQTNRANDVRLHIVPAIGKIRLDKLTPDHVRAMHRAIIDKGRSSTTALRCHRLLSVALRDAVRSGRVSRNVATREYVDAPPAANYEARTYSQDEALQLLAAAANTPGGERWATALLIGARLGEVIGLEWDRVTLDPDDAQVTLSWQLQRLTWSHGCGKAPCGYKRAGSCPQRHIKAPAGFEKRPVKGGLHMVRPKTKTGWRVVPLVDPLYSILDRHHERAGRPATGLVFTAPDGGPIDPRDDLDAWRALLDTAGVPRVRRHDARHTAATLLMALGIDTKVISEILGHSSVVVTRGYQHVNLAQARAAMSALGAHLTPPATQLPPSP